MQKVVRMSEGVFTLEDQAKRLGLDGPQEVYIHRPSPMGRCLHGLINADGTWNLPKPCKCDFCKESK